MGPLSAYQLAASRGPLIEILPPETPQERVSYLSEFSIVLLDLGLVFNCIYVQDMDTLSLCESLADPFPQHRNTSPSPPPPL